MAIAHDVTTNVATAYTVVGTQNTSHAAAAGARAAVVLVEQDGSTTDQISGITYGGLAMTRLGFSTDATEAGAVYIYFRDGVSGGTQTVAMTTTGTTAKYISVHTMTVTTGAKVSPANTNDYESATSSSAANPALTLTGLTAGVPVLAYEVIHSGLQTMTNTPQTTPAWTLITSADLGTTGYGMARIANTPSGTTLTAGWIAGTSDDYVIAGSAFYEDTLQTLTVAGIDASVALSDPALSVGAVTLATAGGIAAPTDPTVGTPVANVQQTLATSGGIASTGAMGASPVANVQQTLATSGGIASAGGIGTPNANVPQTLATAGGIASPTPPTVGTPVVTYANVMYVASIDASTVSTVTTPALSATATLGVAGIASSGAMGASPVANVIQNLNTAGGIASGGAMGASPQTTTPATLTVAGIASAGAMGTPVANVKQNLTVAGIASTSAIGAVGLNTSITVTAVGIDASTAPAAGTPSISTIGTMSVASIVTASVVPDPSLAIIEETWGTLQLV